jgi:hypothetical protein
MAGAITGYIAFSAVCTTNDTVYYTIQAVDANGVRTGEWENGLGTYSGTNTLTRTTPQRSSNANAAVSFSVGTKHVFIDVTQAHLALLAKLVSPSFTTPTLGVASATTINKNTFTTPATGSTWTLVDGKTFTCNNTMTLAGADAQTYTFPAVSDTMAALGTVQTFTKAQRAAVSLLTDASTVALDLSAGNQYFLPIAGNRTLGVPTAIVAGQQGTIKILQDTTGSRTLAYAWVYQWINAVVGVLSTAGCTVDQLVYSVDVYATSTITVTIATPGVVTWNAHGLYNGQPIQLTTTGALPTGLAANTTYWVTNQSTNAFSLSTSLVNAAAGTKIATSGSQSGTHTMVACSIVLALNKGIA